MKGSDFELTRLRALFSALTKSKCIFIDSACFGVMSGNQVGTLNGGAAWLLNDNVLQFRSTFKVYHNCLYSRRIYTTDALSLA